MTQNRPCNHDIGRKMISHGAVVHPGGPQFCFVCRKTLDEIITEAKKQERLTALADVADLIDEFNQGDPDGCAFKVNIPNSVDFASRLYALRDKGGD